ncbi:expressed unknown protein [Seminavis robusta]|uniref:Hedgehog/Intein (Hint) domain-containing protein n=1 Tax=Seminavis robusta TaxID=568900 RepID=A0A9N8EMW6_9STRA|nr:expressed unknown protein [Seminavis robusta]|eukprot:Sro1392_g268800.1 n/a (249) ;mRNA; r:5016-5930
MTRITGLTILVVYLLCCAKADAAKANVRRKLHDDDVHVTLVPCFSADTTVQVERQGTTAMKDLLVGDRIWTDQGHYEPVYAFGHYLPHQTAEFLTLTTGLYAPLVPSASFLVQHNSLLVSSYARMVQDSDHAHFQNGVVIMSQHDGIHLLLTPFRALCTNLLRCDQYSPDGYPPYVDTGMRILTWADQLPLVAQVVLLGLALLIFGILRMLELYGWAAVLVVLWRVAYLNGSSNPRRSSGHLCKIKMA